ncbi:MAG: hypothetical protein R6X02_01080 [Enhygromyxa sp.]
MTRARLYLLLPILLGACERGGRSGTSAPSDGELEQVADDEQARGGELLPIVAVPQRLISLEPAMWRFDPSGRFIAEEFSDRVRGVVACGIWDIESGTFVREQVYAELDDEQAANPCLDWSADPRLLPDTSADGKLRAGVIGGLEIELIGGPTRSIPGCASCDEAMVWAPSGHQLATSNGALLEIWDADAGERLRSETLGLGDVVEVVLGWTAQGIGAVVLHGISGPCEEIEPEGDYCNYAGYEYYDEYYDEGEDEGEPLTIDGYALSSFWWPTDGGPPLVALEQFKSAEPPDFHADAGVRWLAFTRGVEYDRDGSSTTLYVLGVGHRSSGLGYTEDFEEYESLESWDGRWRVDAATQWIEGVTHSVGDYYGSLRVGWRAVVAEPNPGVYRGWHAELEGNAPWGEVEVFAASGGAAAARWDACVDHGDGEECRSGEPPVGDCELLDVSPLLSLALVECEGGLRLLDAGGRGATLASLGHDPGSDWRWGRGNYLALLEPGGKLGVVDLSTGKTLYEREGVVELLEVPLAAEQDRLALAYGDHLEIVAGRSGERIIDLPGDWLAAALSPDKAQLAVLGGKQLRVIDLQSGSTITTAATGDASKLAWRQDGAALFYGHDWPTHALSPKTGALLHELDHPIFEVFEFGELDPSWRWIHRPDGSITRLLDFARIELGPSWARIESGMFEGAIGDLPEDLRFRVGEDPNAPAIYTAAELEPWLSSPGLVRAFFAGEVLPRPQIPVAELAKLEAKNKRGNKR